MSIKSIVFSVPLLALSTSVNSAVLSYGGYTHDDTTNIVTGNGLEWLQWDVTVGESINSIQSQLNTLEGGGWVIASNVQMAELFNAFGFGSYDTDENTYQGYGTGFSAGDPATEPDELFIAMFGDTYAAGGQTYCYYGDCYAASQSWFGSDSDNDLFFNVAQVAEDYMSSEGSGIVGTTRIYDDRWFGYVTDNTYGVALVRDVTAVPIPAAAWLFGSGLIGLIGIARRKKS